MRNEIYFDEDGMLQDNLSDEDIDEGLVQSIDERLRKLGNVAALAVTMRDVHGCSERSIAWLLQVSQTEVRQQVLDGRRQLLDLAPS